MTYNISTKTRLNITIDTDIYIKIKLSNINISETINNFLKEHLEMIDISIPSDEIKKELDQKEEELMKLRVKYSKATNNEKKEHEERIEKAKAMNKALRNSRVLDFD